MEDSVNCAGEPNVPSSTPPSPASVDDEPISVTPRNTAPPSLAPTARPASDCTDSTDDHDNDDVKQRNFVKNLSDKNFRETSNVVRRPGVGLNTNSRSEQRDEIKDYAESTMNELLGWYGYDNAVDSDDTQDLDLHRFSSSKSASGAVAASLASLSRLKLAAATAAVQARVAAAAAVKGLGGVVKANRDTPSNGSSDSVCGRPVTSPSPDSVGSDTTSRHQIQPISSESSPRGDLRSDLRGDRDTESPAPVIVRTASPDIGCADGGPDSQGIDYIVCAWCQNPGLKLFTLKSHSGTKAFCSEICFTQCRRASFKKNKICDWCKHVRHTVNYVDFQDGDQQLQFCSPKCLSQYKMQIFCQETQKHLNELADDSSPTKDKKRQSRPSSPVTAPVQENILITPELWMNEKLGSSSMPKRKQSGESSTERHSGEKRSSYMLSDRKSSSEVKMYNGSGGDTKRMRRDHDRDKSRKLHGSSSMDSTATSPRCTSQLSSSPGPHSETPTDSASSRFLLESMGPAALHQQASMLGLYPSVWGSGGVGLPPGPEILPMLWDPRTYQNLQRPPVVQPSTDHARPASTSSRTESLTRNGSRHSPRQSSTDDPGHDKKEFHPPSAPLCPPQVAAPPHGMFPPMHPMMGGMPPYGFPPGPMMPGILPPNTMMTPYPFIIPLPVPIPIPIPVKEDLFYKYLKKANENKPTQVNIKSEVTSPAEDSTAEKCDDVQPIVIKPRDLHEMDSDISTQVRCDLCKDDVTMDCPECRDTDSFRVSKSDGSASPSTSHGHRPSPTTSSVHQDEVAMDLSKVKPDHTHSASPGSSGMLPGISKPLHVIDQNRAMAAMPSLMPPMPLPIPGVHGGPMMPMRELPYSSRRALLLDAPSVRRESRDRHSPSPEKRLMFRSPSRELTMNKRKCGVRPRIKSK